MRILLKKILCGIDFSDFSNQALAYSMALAKEYKAKLYVCHVIDLPAATMYGEGMADPLLHERRITDYAYEYLNRLIGDAPIVWEPFVTVGHTADELSRLAAEKEADLAVVATHGRSGLKRMLLGSVTERLMHTLPCPLLAVRGPEKGAEVLTAASVPLKRILVGCDFSPYSDLAFEYALSLAQEFESELHLVHVIEPPVYEHIAKTEADVEEGLTEDLRLQIRDTLENLVPEDARAWCKPKTSLLAGHAHEEITKYALVNKMDLIVLGVRGQGLVEKLFIGSTTDRVIRQAQCPVLSVRPKSEPEQP
ncbi:UpsA: universal stress protein [uncultured Desulfatiglans sp.]|nr:UpsA: universal stress protein [uncultured Desulfatiglans sp.]